jgi:ribonucleoside-diphosphate reductase alpha chain
MPSCSDIDCQVEITDSAALEGYRNEIFKLRYAYTPDETWAQACERTANFVGVAENGSEDRERWVNSFAEIIRKFWFIPGGRIMRNAGRKHGMMINCFGLGVDDNTKSIGQLFDEVFNVSSSGGGVGINFSNLRPKGDPIMGKGGFSSGAVSFMGVVDSIAQTVESGGQRRAALMGILRCDHPEIFEFINGKLTEGKLSHFNISVGITDEFLKAVKKNKDFDLKFGNKVYKTIKARELWDLIVHNAWTCAEPGLINLDNLKNFNPLSYCEDINTTNPCGELPLPRYGACCLGSINLSEMYNKNKNEVDWIKLKNVIEIAVRFLDDVIDVTIYPVKDIELTATASRRIGLGVMGLHYLLLKLGIKRYGSDESLEFIDSLMSKIRDYAYLASINLAKEKGPFQKFDKARYMEGLFVKGLPHRVRRELEKYGIRNGAVLSIPPTGTTSIVAGVSSGLEPIFAPVYKRKYNSASKEGGKVIKEVEEYDVLYKEFKDNGKDVSHFVGANDISPWEHMQVQCTAQKYVDSAISKTINMKNDFPEQELGELLLENLPYIKGVTLYRDGSRGEAPLTLVKL